MNEPVAKKRTRRRKKRQFTVQELVEGKQKIKQALARAGISDERRLRSTPDRKDTLLVDYLQRNPLDILEAIARQRPVGMATLEKRGIHHLSNIVAEEIDWRTRAGIPPGQGWVLLRDIYQIRWRGKAIFSENMVHEYLAILEKTRVGGVPILEQQYIIDDKTKQRTRAFRINDDPTVFREFFLAHIRERSHVLFMESHYFMRNEPLFLQWTIAVLGALFPRMQLLEWTPPGDDRLLLVVCVGFVNGLPDPFYYYHTNRETFDRLAQDLNAPAQHYLNACVVTPIGAAAMGTSGTLSLPQELVETWTERIACCNLIHHAATTHYHALMYAKNRFQMNNKALEARITRVRTTILPTTQLLLHLAETAAREELAQALHCEPQEPKHKA